MDDLLLRQQCVLGLQQPGISSKEQNYNLSYTMSCSFILQICVKKKSNHYRSQSMRNLVCRRSMSGKTGLRLEEILGLPVTMTGNFCKILLYIQ